MTDAPAPAQFDSATDVTTTSEFYKVMVVGDYGDGKSVFASTFPTPGFVFDFDQGILSYKGKDFKYKQFQTSSAGWAEFEKTFRDVKTLVENGEIKTVVVDSTSTMTDCAMERALMLDPKRSSTNGPLWNVHYQMVRNLMEGMLRKIMSLPCNIVVISHKEIKTDEETGAIVAIQPLLTGKLSAKLPGYFDEVYFATSKVINGKTKYFLQTRARGLTKARSRISGVEQILPTFMPNDYKSVMAYIANNKQQE